jgi:hypothetical protein
MGAELQYLQLEKSFCLLINFRIKVEKIIAQMRVEYSNLF